MILICLSPDPDSASGNDPGSGPGAGIATKGRFRYTGQAWFPELGMYYYKARMYCPTTGRFLQTDPIGYEDQFNLYAYVGNDPVNGVDPSGLAIELAEEGREANLQNINSLSRTQYTTNESGELSATDAINKNGSSAYSDSIDQGIASENTGTISLDPDATVLGGRSIDGPGVGGGLTQGFTGEDQRVIVSGNGLIESGMDASGNFVQVEITPAEALMHEIVEHMTPGLLGEAPNVDGTRGLLRDNAIRGQLGRTLRPPNPGHATTIIRFGQ